MHTMFAVFFVIISLYFGVWRRLNELTQLYYCGL
jgi:hypothetical protein